MSHRPFPIDFSTLTPDTRPRRWLVLPEGFDAHAEPDQVSPVFSDELSVLLDNFKQMALKQPRVQLVREAEHQIELVQRSRLFRFPDYITVQAVRAGDKSALAIYSRAVIGYSDMGVNRKRIKAWLDVFQSA